MPSKPPRPVLTDAATAPDDPILAEVLGPAKAAYDALHLRLAATCPAAVATWKYYRDGNAWLMSVAWKKKTLFWLSADHGFFRTTFYLPSALEAELVSSDLPEPVKQGYAASAGKKIRGATAVTRVPADLATFDTLLALRLSVR
ncbi:MAG: hypothetical protein CVU65_09515 [Deltaproteobacteria bacterium HGW-Deltaproteobacteria-22]|nr:MAG: hypothetical protein CVU65_09515 [Deltaproteobacteria bacterium HGW-Deltaproteobacteria-22]